MLEEKDALSLLEQWVGQERISEEAEAAKNIYNAWVIYRWHCSWQDIISINEECHSRKCCHVSPQKVCNINP